MGAVPEPRLPVMRPPAETDERVGFPQLINKGVVAELPLTRTIFAIGVDPPARDEAAGTVTFRNTEKAQLI